MAVATLQVTDATIISNLTAGTKNDYPNIPFGLRRSISLRRVGR
jgi:hypothetical protein